MKPTGLTTMKDESGAARRRRASVALAALLALSTGGPASADDERSAMAWTGTYAGVFSGTARAYNRLIDVEGYANWGNPGSTVDYKDVGFAPGVLAGRTLDIDGMRFRIEIDATLGNTEAGTTRLDPTCPDEAANSELKWMTSLRAGIQETVGPVTIFASAGLAAARLVNSVTDTDFRGTCLEMQLHLDQDDSFRDESTELGWLVGIGLEAPVANAWTLRFESSYLDFGRNGYYVNRSGDNRCGRGGAQRPCLYEVENRFHVMRVGLTRRFGG